MKKRSDLPNFGKLKNVKYSVEKLLNFCVDNNLLDYSCYNDLNLKSSSEFKNFIVENQFNRAFLLSEDERKNTSTSLDEYSNSKEYVQYYATTLSDEALEKAHSFSKNPFSMKDRLRRLNKDSTAYSAYADELNYTKRKPIVKDYLQEILNIFDGQVTRTRFAAMNPNFEIVPHIDYDTDYIMRYHFPIITNPESKFKVWRKNVLYETHFPATGDIYFLNTGYKHTALNYGAEPRLHLIVDVHGQQDIEKYGLESII